MRKLLFTALSLVGITSFAQQVSTFAGKQNDDPLSNLNNVSSTLADAYFYEPEGLAFDKNGNMYVTERNKIRYVIGNNIHNRAGMTGDPTFSLGFRDGTGNASRFYNPTGVVCNSDGEALVVDAENHAIRKITPYLSLGSGQQVSTFAGALTTNPTGGQGTSGDVDGMGNNARFNTPKGIAIDNTGTLYVTDWFNSTIRKIDPQGNVSTIAGKKGVQGSRDGRGTAAEFNGPYGIAVLDNRTVLVTDQINCNIRKIDLVTGDVTTLTGTSGTSRHKDGTLAEALFMQPLGITILDGLIYVCDYSTVRVIDIAGNSVTTLAGSPSAQGNENGNGSAARFGELSGITAKDDALYVADRFYHVIKKITIDNLTPRADFTASKRSVLVNESTTLSDASGGKKPFLSYQWTITLSDGSPANYTKLSGDEASAELTVSFPTTGFYDVSLKIVNDYGENSIKKDGFFSVSTTGSVSTTENKEINVYPNPAKDRIYVQLQDIQLSNPRLSLYDASGRVVASDYTDSGNLMEVSVGQLEPGMYYVVIQSDQYRGFKSFVKQ